jgi:hypothetical protein
LSHICLNCALNSEPLSYPIYWGRGYLVNHILLNASMTLLAFLSAISVTSNQFVIGLIIGKAQSVCVAVAVGVRTTYGPIKSMFTGDHESPSASFGGKCPYFFRCFLNS